MRTCFNVWRPRLSEIANMAVSHPFSIEVGPRPQSVIAVTYLALAITAFAVGYATHYPATRAPYQTIRSNNAGMTAPWR
jgi:hypothetical protein